MSDLQKGSTPVPDPTVLTTAQLLGAIEAVKELLRAELHGLSMTVDARLEAMRKLDDEKFRGIQTQFSERDTRTEQSSRDSKVAVDAALQAAKEAVGKQQEASDRAIAKQEASTTKQLEAIALLIASNTKAADDKIDDLKDRLTRIEGKGQGASLTWGYIVGAIGAAWGLFALLQSFSHLFQK